MFLFDEISVLKKTGAYKDFPPFIRENLNPEFELRPYQKEAFQNFITYFETSGIKKRPTQTLFHMATGSGKTLVMAGLILYLYQQGYHNFLFFVHLDNIVQKTKNNFLDTRSSKYLFQDSITFDRKKILVREVKNFDDSIDSAINICFTTIQGLHSDLRMVKENALTFEDFADKKIVFISDEAHHLNADTKKGGTINGFDEVKTWEETVTRVFNQNLDNVLLEFTATCDVENAFIRNAYEDKIIFNYPLKKFRKDKYSKEVIALNADIPLMDRAIQAIMLSQYRLKIFHENRLDIKPVVLFKAARIDDSKNFMAQFLKCLDNLGGKELQRIASAGISDVLKEMYQFFDKIGLSFDQLANELKTEFCAERCISVNESAEAEQNQIIVNSLEDKTNPYRAVFEVKKLDEGWDCLNLFDIVRLYETRDAKSNKPGAGTIAEAQLIGRGARYCPFQLNTEQPKYQRKYDDDQKNPLRICETLYYHCQNDSRYISELRTALQETGMLDFNELDFEHEIKPEVKNSPFYKNSIVFANVRKEERKKNIMEFLSSLCAQPYSVKVATGDMAVDALLGNEHKENLRKSKWEHITLKEIADLNYSIVHKAIQQIDIFKFDVLRQYLPDITNMRDFITKDDFLGKMSFIIESTEDALNPQGYYEACFQGLQKIGADIAKNEKTYYGTTEFFGFPLSSIFTDKSIHVSDRQDQGVGISQNDRSLPDDLRLDLSTKDWFVFKDNYGTTEEKAFVKYFETWADTLKAKYDKVYLVRNERQLALYSFKSGERFEPDYLLFLQEKNGAGYKQYQIFIEPKGTHLLEHDKWKEDFLREIEKTGKMPEVLIDNNEYKILGFPFYNQDKRMGEFSAAMEGL